MTRSFTALNQLAARQHGVVSTLQLRSLGFGAEAIRHQVRRELLIRVHRGVYALSSPELSDLGRFAAALLACGPGSLLSHRSAAILWKLLDPAPGPVDVSTPGRQLRARPGIRTHEVAVLHARDRRKRKGLPVTSPSVTVFDLAAVDAGLAEEAWNEALLQRLSSEGEVAALLGRRRGHAGAAVIRGLLATSGGGFSRQEAERIMIGLIRDAGLAEPMRNVAVHGHELDFWWPERRLNVEVDGYRWHSTRARLNRDRDRDAELTTHGIHVLRFSYDQLRRPKRVVAHLAAAIALAGRQ